MFGYTMQYSGESNSFNVVNSTTPSYFNKRTIYNPGFRYIPCEGALMDTLNIYNYQFLFDDVFGNILYDFMNKTKFPEKMEEIMPYKNMIHERIEKELDRLNTLIVENSTEWNTISHLISTMGKSYFNITKNGTAEYFIIKPKSLLGEVRNLVNNSFDNLYESFYNLMNTGVQNRNGNESETNYVNLYWQKIMSGYDTMKKVAQNSFENDTIFGFQNVSKIWNLNNLANFDTNDNKTGNESQNSDNIFGWFTNRIEVQTNKFMTYLKPYANVSYYF